MSAQLLPRDDDLPPDAWGKERADAFKAAFFEFLGHVQVASKEKGWIILGEHLYDAQIRVIDDIFDGLANGVHEFKVLKSRQLGISTIIRALMLFWIGVFGGTTGSLIFDTAQHLDEARRELVKMLELLPASYRFPRKKTDNRYSVSLMNESRVNLASAGVKESKSSGSLGRGSGISVAHRSELCMYGNLAGLEAWRHSLARTNPNRLFIDESTANGPNIWKEIWDDAEGDSRVRRIFVGWWSHPDQKMDRNDPDWSRFGNYPPSDKEMGRIRAVKKMYGHDVTPEQLAWIRREMVPNAEVDGDAAPDFEGDNLRLQEQAWCVTAETRVGTTDGIVRIDQISPGVWGLRNTFGDVVGAGPTGRSPIWKATTSLGYQVRGTPNHPLIDWSGDEVRLDEALGKRVRLAAPLFAEREFTIRWQIGPVQHSIVVTPDFARLIGLYMGDGSLRRAPKTGGGGYFAVTCDRKDQDVVEEVKRLIRSVWGLEPRVKQQQSNCDDVYVGSRFMVETFKVIGLSTTATGPTRRKIHVPEFIWRSPKHVVKEFLSGLFEADGFNGYGVDKVSLFSKYPQFIRDVQLLLLGFGITSKFSVQNKKNAKGLEYTGNELRMRTAESRRFNAEIGFLSARKRSRSHPTLNKRGWKTGPYAEIVLEDVVEKVEDERVEEEVFNLTVGGRHWFDANGIVTHNTEIESFLFTGSVFFDPDKLTEQMNKNASAKFKPYYFMFGQEFTHSTAIVSPNVRSIHFKVWESPVEDSIYIVAADPAYGHSERSDRSCIQVVRAFSDGLDQVAEYKSPLVTAQQLAWAIAAIEAWYAGEASHVYQMIEINGPGEGVLAELQQLRRQIAMGYFGKALAEKGLERMQQNVHRYFYQRTDSLRPGTALEWRTSGANKVGMLERLRDFVHTGVLRVRSLDTLEEMRTVSREGDSIEAQGTAKDDGVMGLALAIKNWDQKARGRCIAEKRSREMEQKRKYMTIGDQAALYQQNMLDTFLAGRGAERRRQTAMARRASWRSA